MQTILEIYYPKFGLKVGPFNVHNNSYSFRFFVTLALLSPGPASPRALHSCNVFHARLFAVLEYHSAHFGKATATGDQGDEGSEENDDTSDGDYVRL